MMYFMEELTVKELKEAMKKTHTAVVPVGIMEQHGHHLPLCTDTLYVMEPLKAIRDRVNCVLVPPVNHCFSGGELPGTINVNPVIFSLYVCDICRSLFHQGFRNVVVVLAHGGTENYGVLENELSMFLRLNPQFKDNNLALVKPQKFYKKSTLANIAQPDGHSGKRETSLILYWRPDLVKMDMLSYDDEELLEKLMSDQDYYETYSKNIDSEHIVARPYQREEVKIGIMGRPESASAELGKMLSKDMEEGLTQFLNMLEEKLQ